jgi:hypothetical protein
MDAYELRKYISSIILPKNSFAIGRREQFAAAISPETHYTISLYAEGSKDPEMAYFAFDESGKELNGVFFKGKCPQKGDHIKLDMFIPGITSGMNYGLFNMPVREVKRRGMLLEAIIYTEDMKTNRIERD